VAEKSHYYPTPCTLVHSPVRGRGKEGASSTALKICLIKRELHYLNYHQKPTRVLKITFLMKTSETKKFVKIFARHFRFFKNILLQPSRTYFHFYKKAF
jgi:hypothetical protein